MTMFQVGLIYYKLLTPSKKKQSIFSQSLLQMFTCASVIVWLIYEIKNCPEISEYDVSTPIKIHLQKQILLNLMQVHLKLGKL